MPSTRRIIGFVLAGLLTATSPLAFRGQTAPDKLDRLRHQIEQVVRNKDGHVGLAIRHIETGQSLSINGDMPFPMASTFKVPILVELLAQVKDGRYRLEDEIEVQKSDQHLGSGMISSLAAPGIKLTVLNMAHFMMMISDNSATDILLAKVGAGNVNARLKGLGMEGISVDRSCQQLITDLLSTLGGARARDLVKAAYIKFGEDPRDRATPEAMTSLLEKIQRREILDPGSCDLIIQIMMKCETGEARIKGQLPPGTTLAHKTGTIAGTVNDCGIITLPDGQGHLVLSIFTKDFVEETAEIEAIIAKIARLAFDYFLFAN
jgi:beta-lactamase class A